MRVGRINKGYQPTQTPVWQDNRDVEYKVLRTPTGNENWFNHVPFERNFARPYYTPWDTAYYPFDVVQTVLQSETPANPHAMIQHESDYVPISHSAVDARGVRPYNENLGRPW